MTYLLDTCTFLWLATHPLHLSKDAELVINDPQNALYLSDVSVWEISLKARTGKLKFQQPLRTWIPAMRRRHKLVPLSLHESAIFLSGELPDLHRDPFDRLLAAQAMDEDLPILSPDSPMTSLGAKRVW
jgi:PIN domain nuclease of toxin-antitoxin system